MISITPRTTIAIMSASKLTEQDAELEVERTKKEASDQGDVVYSTMQLINKLKKDENKNAKKLRETLKKMIEELNCTYQLVEKVLEKLLDLKDFMRDSWIKETNDMLKDIEKHIQLYTEELDKIA